MKLSDLGEKKVVEGLRSFLDVGDDAAVLEHGGEYLVLTTDLVYAKTDILDEMDWDDIGRYVVSVNFSDVAAMGAKPLCFLLSYGSPDMEVEDFETMMHSIDEQCRRYDARFIGGDLNETDELTLAGTAMGKTDKPVYRRGAKPGDLVCVTGCLGDASLGVRILVGNLAEKCDESLLDGVLESVFNPNPRVSEGFYLRDYATSMTDVSDSLALSLYDIAGEGRVGIKINSRGIPLSEGGRKLALTLNVDLVDCALFGGGDYELLFTIPKEHEERVCRKTNASVIGGVVEGSGVLVDGRVLDARGYQHFKGGR